MCSYTRTKVFIVLPRKQKYMVLIKVSSQMPATRILLLYQRNKSPNKGIREDFVVYLCRPSGRYRFLWSPERPASGEARGGSSFSLFALTFLWFSYCPNATAIFWPFLLRMAKFRKFGSEVLIFSDHSPDVCGEVCYATFDSLRRNSLNDEVYLLCTFA